MTGEMERAEKAEDLIPRNRVPNDQISLLWALTDADAGLGWAVIEGRQAGRQLNHRFRVTEICTAVEGSLLGSTVNCKQNT